MRRRVPVRVVIADDAVLLREGLVRLLTEQGHEVVAAVGDGPSLVAAAAEHRPDVSIVDVRMPPSHTDEGLRAAVAIRTARPGAPVLVLSQYVEVSYADDLLADRRGAIGYLLKDRVADIAEFLDALRPGRRRRHGARPRGGGPVAGTTSRARPAGRAHPREREVLGADGRGPVQHRHRPATGGQRGRGGEARPQHLRQARPAAGRGACNRRVLAVLAFLRS